MLIRLFAVFLLALAVPAEAAIYKCRQADGKTTYQGTPCPESTTTTVPKPDNSAPQDKGAQPKGKCAEGKLSIDFSDMPILTTLQVVADYSGNKLVADPRVQGSGAFRYPCTPWREVLQDIASKHALSAQVESGRIVVAPRTPQPGGKNK